MDKVFIIGAENTSTTNVFYLTEKLLPDIILIDWV
jgi:hypothetical protein